MVYITSILALLFFILCVILYTKYKTKCKNIKKLEETNFKENQYKNVVSMIEYETRNYQEGQNAFTTLRNIQNTIYTLKKD